MPQRVPQSANGQGLIHTVGRVSLLRLHDVRVDVHGRRDRAVAERFHDRLEADAPAEHDRRRRDERRGLAGPPAVPAFRADGWARVADLSPDVASALIEDPGRAALGGDEVEVTVLFADLRGYTTYAERRAPAEVVAMLNLAFGVAVPIVLAEGGAVVQFMGDAMMAIFNAPNPQTDHALRAARAALAMQQGIGELPGATTRPQFRIGLNSGLALVGNIGAAEMRNFSALGDTTNLAARLQTYAAEGSVVIGAGTYDLIREQAVVRPLGSPQLKGKSQPVEAYELLGLRNGAGDA